MSTNDRENPVKKFEGLKATGKPFKVVATEPIVKQTAHLSRLKLTDEEIDRFTPQLTSILNYIAKISELDLENVEPLVHVGELKNVWREDEVERTDVHDKLMNLAPEAKRGHFRVPRIIEE